MPVKSPIKKITWCPKALKVLEFVDQDRMAQMIRRGRIEAAFTCSRWFSFKKRASFDFEFGPLNDLHDSAEDQFFSS